MQAATREPLPLQKANRFFDSPLGLRSRILVIVAALALIPTFVLPLWNLTLYSNQFPDGLDLSIYSHKLVGGHSADRDDLKEINTLNHYIGMRPLEEGDFTEFLWLPLVVGAFVILSLRTAVLGKMANLVDNTVLFAYFGLFALWSFYYRLYQYGHTLSSDAAVKVPPFTPPLFGSRQMANFTIYSYPGAATWFMAVFVLLLTAAIWFSRPRTRAVPA
jgi:hypothetical protein